jgi:hypothetical protein
MDGGTTEEFRNDMEESSCDIIDVLWHSGGGTEHKQVRTPGVRAGSRTEHLLNTCLQLYL